MSQKTALVTGASAGIGRATSIALSAAGYQLILLARREDKLIALQDELVTASYIIACDINNQACLDKSLAELPHAFSSIDVLINNAGLALGMSIANESDWLNWQTMIQTNCVSLAYMTHKILPNMVKRNIGHIVNLGSTAGNYAYKGGNVYGATKAFVDQFSINLRSDLLGTNVRVTNLVPGLLGDTEFSLVRFDGDEAAADSVYEGCQALCPEDVAESIRWVVSQPAHVNINRLEIMPTCQAPAGLAVNKKSQ